VAPISAATNAFDFRQSNFLLGSELNGLIDAIEETVCWALKGIDIIHNF
jgi:hypothetical protein